MTSTLQFTLLLLRLAIIDFHKDQIQSPHLMQSVWRYEDCFYDGSFRCSPITLQIHPSDYNIYQMPSTK